MANLKVLYVKCVRSIMSTKENDVCAQTHFVGKREDLVQAKRVVRTVDGREIIIIYHSDTFFALDLHCYRE